MSSHHFVKEGQEPALFLLDRIPYSKVESLLEWAPYVIAHEEVLDEVLSWGIKIDVVLLSRERRHLFQTMLSERQDVEIILLESEDVIREGVVVLKGRKQFAANMTVRDAASILAMTAGIIQSCQFQIDLLEEEWRWVPVTGQFDKWVPAGTEFQLRKTAPKQEVYISGVPTALQRFETESDGIITISSSDLFWLGESY